MKTTKPKKTRRPSRTHFSDLRKALLERREELIAHMNSGLADSRLDTVGARFDDIADRASDSLYNELAQGVAEIATANLRKIDHALERIDAKTYGRCEDCGKVIPKARLRMLPFADLCVACQRELEEGDPGSHWDPHQN